MVLYYKLSSPTEQKGGSYYTNKLRNQSGNVHYDRMMVVMDMNATPCNNVITFLFGKGQNHAFYDANIESRDNGNLGKYY